jgi:hypothetical protein
MDKIKRFVQFRTTSGEPVKKDDVTVTPISQALIITFPYGGFVWNRPLAIEVDDGKTIKRIPILDVTRIAQLSLIGVGFIFTIMALLFSRKS